MYFTALFARTEVGWVGADADLATAAGLDDFADQMREAMVESAGDLVLLFIEQEDEWFAVLRLDDADDPRVFLSDPRASLISDLAAFLYDLEEPPTEDPYGDPELLADLGTSAAELTRLGERALPGDALAGIADRAGFTDEFERLR